MTVDLHCHYVPAALAEALRQRNVAPWIETAGDQEWLHLPIGRLAFEAAYTDMDERLAFMDQHGVDRQVLSFPGLFGLDSRPAAEALPLLRLFNDDAAALCDKHPDRFSALAALPFDDLEGAVAEYRRARNDLGLIGAILPNNCFLTIEGARSLLPLFDAAEALGGHLFIHPGRRPDEAKAMDAAGEIHYPDSVMARRQLDIQNQVAQAMVSLIYGGLLDGYGKFSLHVANIGGTLPLVIERIAETARLRAPADAPPLARLDRIHVDCSSMGPRAIEAAVALYGGKRLVLGTDCPIYDTAAALAAIDTARLDEETKQAIRQDNAQTMLGTLVG